MPSVNGGVKHLSGIQPPKLLWVEGRALILRPTRSRTMLLDTAANIYSRCVNSSSSRVGMLQWTITDLVSMLGMTWCQQGASQATMPDPSSSSSSSSQQRTSLLILDGTCLLTRTELQLLRAHLCTDKTIMVGQQNRNTVNRLVSMGALNTLVSRKRLIIHRVGRQNRRKNADISCMLKLMNLNANINQ